MGKIFKNQSALRFTVDTGVNLTGATTTQLKYVKPDASSGNFDCTVSDATNGIMYYDVLLTTEIDQSGTWIMYSYVVFSDGRSAHGESVKVRVYDVGEII